jgi:TrmH family RNA methyltransferase
MHENMINFGKNYQEFMISKRKLKELRALQLKKFRQERGIFVAEGEKIIDELLNSELEIVSIIATPHWINLHARCESRCGELIELSGEELKKLSSLQTPNQVISVARIPGWRTNMESLAEKLVLVIDEVQDPGNLGTIIRVADWFGIDHIICSNTTVDAYNPKVVQSSMGSLFRVTVDYISLPEWIHNYCKSFANPVYGTFTKGANIYEHELSPTGLIIMGNESKGISPSLYGYISERITIPHLRDSQAESLNVSVATAIVCSEFRRRGKQDVHSK